MLIQRRLSLITVTVALATAAAGCDRKASGPCAGGVDAEISGNHGHTFDVPAEHFTRDLGGSYAVRGGDHEHTAPLTDANIAALKKGESVTTRTTSVRGHGHEITVRCKP